MKILLNPAYILKPDGDSVLLLGRTGLYSLSETANLSFTGVIHPLHAIILSFIDGSDYESVVSRVINFIPIERKFVESFILKLIDNPDDVGFVYEGVTIGFPKNLIISRFSYKNPFHRYNPSDFIIDRFNLKYRRHKTVSFITLMLNNICATQCYYCYADKRRPTNCTLPLSKILELIQEAKRLNVVSFDLIGGEVFLYPHWKELLFSLVENDYYPFVSTKIPLSKEDIDIFATYNLPLQFSLDSLISETLEKTLKVGKNYTNKVKSMLLYMEEKKIPVAIHSVLHQWNANLKDMSSLFDFLNERKNILYWKPDIGNESIYSLPKYRGKVTPPTDSLTELFNYFKHISVASKIEIKYQGLESPIPEVDSANDLTTQEEKVKSFLNRAYCAGNFSQIFILPDGKVTICEELYWHPHFIIGDVERQSIDEIWNSDKALSLYHVKQSAISSKSKCHSCTLFERCRSEKQICYRDIIRKNGSKKWDLPDVNCPLQ